MSMTVQEIFTLDKRIHAVRVYCDGHCPDSEDLETWGYAGHYVRDNRMAKGYRVMPQLYNRKAYGPRGPAWIAITALGRILDYGQLLPRNVYPEGSAYDPFADYNDLPTIHM